MKPIRIPVPPAVLFSFMFGALLLFVGYQIAPPTLQIALGATSGLLVMMVAFINIELALYLLILSTLLSPELTFGAATKAELAAGMVTTTESRGITIRVDDILLTLICITWMFHVAVFKDIGLFRATPLNRPIAAYIAVAVLATLLGGMAGRVGLYGLFFVLKFIEYFFLFFMISNYIQDKQAIRRYLVVMLFTFFVVTLIGLVQIPTGERVTAPFEGEEGEPNTFGGYLVLMIAVSLGMFLYAEDWRQRIVLGICIVLAVITLAFTLSRSSYLAFVAMYLLFLVLSERKRFLAIIALIGLVAAPVTLPQSVLQRVQYTFFQQPEPGQIKVGALRIDTSTSERLRAWERALTEDYPKHPLLGFGVTGGPFMDAQYPRVLTEMGLVGLVVFLWLLRRMWVVLRRCYADLEDPWLKGASLGTLCGYGGLLFHAIGSNTFIIVRIMEPLMILLGLLTAGWLLKQEGLQTTQTVGE